MYDLYINHNIFLHYVKKKIAAEFSAAIQKGNLFLSEGHTVGALVNSGVALMGAHQDLLQGAVVCLVTMMCALLYGTLDALVGIAIHSPFLLFW